MQARSSKAEADLGDLVIVLLAGTLAGLQERLARDGFEEAADTVAELTKRCDSFIEGQKR